MIPLRADTGSQLISPTSKEAIEASTSYCFGPAPAEGPNHIPGCEPVCQYRTKLLPPRPRRTVQQQQEYDGKDDDNDDDEEWTILSSPLPLSFKDAVIVSPQRRMETWATMRLERILAMIQWVLEWQPEKWFVRSPDVTGDRDLAASSPVQGPPRQAPHSTGAYGEKESTRENNTADTPLGSAAASGERYFLRNGLKRKFVRPFLIISHVFLSIYIERIKWKRTSALPEKSNMKDIKPVRRSLSSSLMKPPPQDESEF